MGSVVIIDDYGEKEKKDAFRITNWALRSFGYVKASKMLKKQYNILIHLEVF